MVGNLLESKMKYLFIFSLFLMACTKKSDSDPLISFRTRTARLIGDWKLIRYYYYDGKKSGTSNSGDPFTTYYRLKTNGDWLICDSLYQEIRQLGYWNWVYPDKKKDKEQKFILGYQISGVNGGFIHILERLSYTQIRTREYFDVSDEKRYMIYEWKRRE